VTLQPEPTSDDRVWAEARADWLDERDALEPEHPTRAEVEADERDERG
jgi:hypothetical protein